MSLNGLDDAKVKEAHDTAVAEPGGWFLLKYKSRDEIELLGRGNGGIVEIRNSIAQYEEASPLFGFLRYRRRNVVIKYVPEECSRLVQARAQVHFTAVTERFSPHDTVFPITTSKELRDTTLSAACSLHTASGSTSSSTSSLRRRRLMEIAEDEEEENKAKRQSTVPEERPSTAKAPSITGQSVPPSSPPPALPTGLAPSTSYRSMAPETESSLFQSNENEPRKSSQSTRPELYSYSSYGSNGKPKIKLGPRPSLDVGGRPHTSGAASHYRPVSTLPPGLKLFSRGSKNEKSRPQSQYHSETPSMMVSPPMIPENSQSLQTNPVRPHTSGGRPNTSSGASTKPLTSTNTNAPKMPSITPEKARLMKAMELRKKQREMSLKAPSSEQNLDLDEGPKSPTPQNNRIPIAPKEVQDTLAMLNDMAKEDDSGIAFDARSTLKTDESDATRSDSYPVSPVGPSEQAESTRASSISESTDETIQEAQTTKPSSVIEEKSNENSIPATRDHGLSPIPSSDEGTSEKSTLQIPPQHESSEPPSSQETKSEEAAIRMFPDHVAVPISTAEQERAEGLPILLPFTYEPVPSPIAVPEIHREEVHQVEEPALAEIVAKVEPTEPPIESLDNKTSPAALEELARPILEIEQLGLPNHKTREEPNQVKQPDEETVEELEEAPAVPIKEWKVPRSKFSVQDLKGAEVPSVPTEPVPQSINPKYLAISSKSPVGSTFSIDTKRSLTEDGQDIGQQSSKRMKRRALVEPIRTDIELTDKSAANSDANFSSDDELMEELQSAVFQEAKPISVSKSPMSPVFPSPKKAAGNRFSRAFSASVKKDSSESQLLTPPNKSENSRSVSASAAYLTRISQQPAKPMATKVNLGTGISQRIKALEKLSSVAPGATPTSASTGPTPGPSPAFFSVRKGSVRGSRSPSIAERANSLNRTTPSPSNSPNSSPEAFKLRGRSGSIQTRVDAFKASPVPSGQPPKSRPESISVTARIVRDPKQPFPTMLDVGKDPSEYTPLDLKQSPLVIDHQKAITTSTKETLQERRLSSSSKTTTARERRSSITVVKDLINQGRASFSEHRRSITIEPSVSSPSVMSPNRPPSTHTNGSTGPHRALSISSRRSGSRSRDIGGSFSPPPTAGSSSSTNDEKEKKSNRASRMLRRMSSSISSTRKSLAHTMSPTVREESEAFVSPSPHSSISSAIPTTTTSVNIGDVNVQFPDTLLWKRRSMVLDSQGYLIISPALTAHGNGRDKASTGATRRFHLSEFRTPTIPDVEMQELPNSVVLDFVEGGGLQIACEDRSGQGHVLHILQDAHRNWAAYGQ